MNSNNYSTTPVGNTGVDCTSQTTQPYNSSQHQGSGVVSPGGCQGQGKQVNRTDGQRLSSDCSDLQGVQASGGVSPDGGGKQVCGKQVNRTRGQNFDSDCPNLSEVHGFDGDFPGDGKNQGQDRRVNRTPLAKNQLHQGFQEFFSDVAKYADFRERFLLSRPLGFGLVQGNDEERGELDCDPLALDSVVGFFAFTVPESFLPDLADFLGCESDRLGECNSVSLISLPKLPDGTVYIRIIPAWMVSPYPAPENFSDFIGQVESAGGNSLGFFETSLQSYKNGYIPGAIRFNDYGDKGLDCEAKIDWLTGTFPIENFQAVCKLVELYLGGEVSPDDKNKLKYYKKRYCNPLGVILGTGHYSDPSHGYLEICGSVLSYIHPDKLYQCFKSLNQLKFIATRLDVCIDIFHRPFFLQFAIDAGNARHYTRFRNSFLLIQNGSHGDKGMTASWGNRGSAGSGKRLEIYDKYLESKGQRKCIRIELAFFNASSPRSGDLNGCYAHNSFLSFCCNPVSSWGSMIRSYIVGAIDFVDRSTPSGRLNQPCRSKRYSWWEEFCNDADPKVLPPKQLITSVRRAVNWFRKIAPTISMIRSVFEALGGSICWDKFISKVLYDGKERMSEKHYAAANQSIAQINHLIHSDSEKNIDRILDALAVGDLLKDEIKSEQEMTRRRLNTNRCMSFLDKLHDLSDNSDAFFWDDIIAEYQEIESISDDSDLPDNYWRVCAQFLGDFSEYVDDKTGLCFYKHYSESSTQFVESVVKVPEVLESTGRRYLYNGESHFVHIMDSLGKWVKAWFERGVELEETEQVSSNDSVVYVRPIGQSFSSGFPIPLCNLQFIG